MILRRLTRLGLAAGLSATGACGGDRENVPVPPVVASSTTPVIEVPPTSNRNWKIEAGPVMLAATEQNGDSGVIILPEVTDSVMHLDSVPDAQIVRYAMDLFAREGKVGTASVTVFRQTYGGECRGWPAATMVRSAPTGWNIGFAAGRVQPIALDSIEGLSRADSAATTATLARLAALLPVAPDRAFRGLPFRVRGAYSFEYDSAQVLVGDIIRSINQEANPRVEHLLLIAEKKTRGAPYTLAYFTRNAHREELVQLTEILAAIRTGSPPRPVLVVNLIYGEGGRFGLLERVSAGRWKMTWKSAYTGC